MPLARWPSPCPITTGPLHQSLLPPVSYPCFLGDFDFPHTARRLQQQHPQLIIPPRFSLVNSSLFPPSLLTSEKMIVSVWHRTTRLTAGERRPLHTGNHSPRSPGFLLQRQPASQCAQAKLCLGHLLSLITLAQRDLLGSEGCTSRGQAVASFLLR
ncbi:hypothetical protein LX32DRAFT_147794 [Colletotrichum zoysiae]|uniref:Uncharacterized protein n=1 Tax=Colletotrichum zoysiae TaxID=1216348 RepID=A0AAD9H8J5_9PEZI|nr:hypothetical protein LX32DRAFT_147794 [Colletotrichum zoysiae]